MEAKTRNLLNKIQTDFPVVSRPFLAIANELDMTEDEVITRIKHLKETGYIRRLGGVFNSKSLGYTSTLCAMKVPEDRIEQVTSIVNSYGSVTHNYLRSHCYNMWFTLTAPSKSDIKAILNEIKVQSGVMDTMVLEGIKTFKIKVNFNLGENSL